MKEFQPTLLVLKPMELGKKIRLRNIRELKAMEAILSRGIEVCLALSGIYHRQLKDSRKETKAAFSPGIDAITLAQLV